MNAAKTTSRFLVLLIALGLSLLSSAARADECGPRDDGDRCGGKRPLVQLAILLDTSNSMDGLINQARAQLWKVVSTLATSRRDGQRPRLEVALYEYGNSGLSASSGYIRRVLPLTTDLDRVSEALFGLTTNGGDEYCGQVIREATRGLDWSANRRDLKLIFIAGNEPFTQGSVDYRVTVKEAIGKGIAVNTVHCGSRSDGVSGGWEDGARLADGSFLNINQDQQVAQIQAPQDDEIARLGGELNQTYVTYGAMGGAGKARQKKADLDAAGLGSSTAAERTAAKAAAAPAAAASWDLVDAVQSGRAEVASVPAESLPPEMQAMDTREREEHVKQMAEKRAAIQSKIQKLAKEREAYVQAEQKKQASGGDTLGDAMLKAIRSQASDKGYELE
jgi:hypothetical protein